jgi:Mn2+/Fe2+ NRAMP family transporter
MVLLVYIPTALWMDVRWIDYLKATLIPTFTFDRAYIMNIVAIMGTTISPYMFFWQSYQEGEEANHHPERTLGQVQCDTWIGMGFSNIISWFIIATAAGTIHLTDPDGISNAAEAAYALKPILGSFAALLFSSGIIGTALITIPVLAATISQAWCDLYEIPAGISLTYREGKTFYRMFAVILLAGLGINLIPVDPIDLLYYTAVINGVLSAPLFWFIAGIIQDERVFGPYTCSNWHKGVVVFGACILSLASLALLVDALM